MPNDSSETQDGLALARQWLERVTTGQNGRESEAATVITALIAEAEATRGMRTNIAEWLRARADVSLARKDDPEQPGHEEFSKGWRSGSYNSLHIAANAVEDGKAELPRELWPAYLRGEQVRRPDPETPREIDDAQTRPAG